MTEIINFISQVGFPIAIAAYLLIRIEAKMDKLILKIGEVQLCRSTRQRR